MCGIGKPAVGHENLGSQEGRIITNLFGNLAADAFDGIEGIDRLILLEVNSGQTVDGLVTHRFRHIAFDDRCDGATGAAMHAVGQFEIPHIEFRFIEMVVEGIELRLINVVMLKKLGIEPGNGIEPLPLKGMVKRFPEEKVLHLLRSRRIRCCR